MSLSVLRDGDGGRNERCQWQDTDSINITGPVGVRVHGTLRRDVLLGCGTAFTIICMHIQYMLIVHFHQSYHNLPVWHKPGWQQIKLILDNPSPPPLHRQPTQCQLIIDSPAPPQRCLTKHYTSHSTMHYTGSWRFAGICLWGHS